METKNTKKLNIVGHEYEIIFDKSKLKDSEWGCCDIKNRKIIISEDVPKDYINSVILHEFLHAVDYHCGLELSHQTITTLDVFFNDFIRQINKWK